METGEMTHTKKMEILEVREMRITKKLIGREISRIYFPDLTNQFLYFHSFGSSLGVK